MTWIPLLLADPSPALRLQVLRDLLDRPLHDPEVQELLTLQIEDPLLSGLLALQTAEGCWQPASLPGNFPGGCVQATACILLRLAFLGLDASHPALQRAAAYLFNMQEADGSWPIAAGYTPEAGEEEVASMPLQTAFPLAGLAACGFATDPRTEKGYEWLLAQRLEDGAWPTGWKSGSMRRVAGYRRLPHSRWGCRSNTTASLLSLAYHPQRCHSAETRRALDLLLGRETHDRSNLGFETARLLGLAPSGGYLTYFARYDPALVLMLCWRVGATLEDERVAGLVDFLHGAQGPYGLWTVPQYPQAARWLSFDLLRSLARLGARGDWISLEPRTPFQAYPRRPRRY